jgi:hypothetical protein
MSDDIPLDELLRGLPPDWETTSGNRDTGLLGVTIVNWRTLTDDQAPEVWQDLGDWVDWFVRRYSIPARKIPSCWYRHGALVEELSALHTAWTVSYDNLDAGYGPIGFHERLTTAMARMATWYNGECHDGHNTVPQTVSEVERLDWNRWIGHSHAG